MTRLALVLVAVGGFLAGAAAMLALVDRLFGGSGVPRVGIDVDELRDPWGFV